MKVERAYFEPWIGKEFNTTKVMILSESAYSWQDEDGNVADPSPNHPTDSLLHWMSHFRKQKYFTAMGRALCGKETPNIEELKKAWDEYAYTIFVQRTVGMGAKRRPSSVMVEKSKSPFLRFLEDIRPLKVIVTGKTMWNHYMPGCSGPHLCDDLQAYKLKDGTLVWCLAVPHPSNRAKGEGFQWEWVGKNIRAFRSIKFPLRGE